MLCFITRACKRYFVEDGRLLDECADIFDADSEHNHYGNFTPFVFFVRHAVYAAYDIILLSCAIVYAVTAAIIAYKRRIISKHRHTEWKVLLHGLLIFFVYGIATAINYELTQNAEQRLEGALAQFVMFIYISLDVTTVLCIPLSIILTVPALRRYPSTIIRRCMMQATSRVFSVRGSDSSRPSP
ncbi:hypothetical protein PENTCL1PPCAC_14246, partial [Pristionchus entomophagus]